MATFQYYLTRHRIAAMWLVTAALLMKIVVPAGYMPVMTGGSIVIELCSGLGPEKMIMAMPGMRDHQGKDHGPQRDDMPCGFAGHAPASMAGSDPVLLLIAIALIITTLFRMPVSWPLRRVDNLRPRLRGPPRIH